MKKGIILLCILVLLSACVSNSKTVSDLASTTDIDFEKTDLETEEQFIYPIDNSVIRTSYGWQRHTLIEGYRFHFGIDIQGTIGTPVKAAKDGIVSNVGNDPIYGLFIVLKHDNDFQTLYAHLSAIKVIKGSNVTQGSIIGEVGNTGYTSGLHLHFGIFKNGKPVNPLDFLK